AAALADGGAEVDGHLDRRPAGSGKRLDGDDGADANIDLAEILVRDRWGLRVVIAHGATLSGALVKEKPGRMARHNKNKTAAFRGKRGGPSLCGPVQRGRKRDRRS